MGNVVVCTSNHFFARNGSKIGVITQKELSEIILLEIHNPLLKKTFLILAVMLLGNTSFGAANINDGMIGLEKLSLEH